MMSAHEMKGMHTVFVLVDSIPGKDTAVLEELLKHEEVTSVHVISGQYDLLAVLEVNLRGQPIFTTVQELARKSVQRIRNLSGVRDTNTIVPFLSFAKRVE